MHDETLDAGPRTTGTRRSCAVTRTVKPTAEMIRFVVDPNGAAVPDLKRRLPGRGIWITATRRALDAAVARKAFARSFKREVRATPDLVDMTERLLERAALDALAVAGKARSIALGFAKTEAALVCEPVVAVLSAADAAPDGVRKIAAALRRREDAAQVRTISAFSSAQLDLALGRTNVIHAALLAGPESETFLARFDRLERFRNGDRTSAETLENRNSNG
jgi:predicted RNA-binding protein YlxR (DUF448 family)